MYLDLFSFACGDIGSRNRVPWNGSFVSEVLSTEGINVSWVSANHSLGVFLEEFWEIWVNLNLLCTKDAVCFL